MCNQINYSFLQSFLHADVRYTELFTKFRDKYSQRLITGVRQICLLLCVCLMGGLPMLRAHDVYCRHGYEYNPSSAEPMATHACKGSETICDLCWSSHFGFSSPLQIVIFRRYLWCVMLQFKVRYVPFVITVVSFLVTLQSTCRRRTIFSARDEGARLSYY
jgi:hypothetical protein